MPTLAIVVGDVHPTVIPLNDVCRVRRIDPHGVVIWVNAVIRSDGFPILSAIVTARHIGPQAIHAVWILWVHSQICIVERTVSRLLTFGHFEPILAAVRALIHAVFLLGFNEGIDDIRIGRCNT